MHPFDVFEAFRRALSGRDDAATAVEYALMVCFIALAIIVAVTALGGKVNGLFSSAVALF